MRALVLLVLLALLLPGAVAQSGAPKATLALTAREDGSESGTLRFDGLRRLTEYQGLCLPSRTTPTRVYDELGELQYQQRTENGRIVIGFRARAEWAAVEVMRTAPDGLEPPFLALDVNFCVPASGPVRIEVSPPPGARLFFLSDGGRIEGERGVVEASGPTHVFYTYERTTPPAGLEVFEEGPFRVFVPFARVEEARTVARYAAQAYPLALARAGLAAPFDKVRVVYGPITASSWEAGHYTGRGYVTVRDASLDPDPTQGYPYTPTKLLVHEAFHAASFPYGRGPVNDTFSWWLEGTARHAERVVDGVMEGMGHHCVKTAREARCWTFDDRIRRADLETGYSAGFRFDVRWEPSLEQTDDTRRFYYGWSEFVVGAFIAQHGETAYRDSWDALQVAFATGRGCPCDDGWFFDRLSEATGASPDDILRPWADVRVGDPARFEGLVKPFVKDEEAERQRLEAMRPGPFDSVALPVPALPVGLVLALAFALATARSRRSR